MGRLLMHFAYLKELPPWLPLHLHNIMPVDNRVLKEESRWDVWRESISGKLVMAGWDEISRLKDILEDGQSFSGGQCTVLPLHSMVPSADQRRVFKRPALGVRKVCWKTCHYKMRACYAQKQLPPCVITGVQPTIMQLPVVLELVCCY